MALIDCIECGKTISDKAMCCPNCGCPREYFSNNQLKQTVCDECGLVITGEPESCLNCGYPLQQNGSLHENYISEGNHSKNDSLYGNENIKHPINQEEPIQIEKKNKTRSAIYRVISIIAILVVLLIYAFWEDIKFHFSDDYLEYLKYLKYYEGLENYTDYTQQLIDEKKVTIGFSTINSLILRDGPELSYQNIGKTYSGDMFQILGESDHYYLINAFHTYRGDKYGWVYKKNVIKKTLTLDELKMMSRGN